MGLHFDSSCFETQFMMAGTEVYISDLCIPARGSPQLFTPIKTTPDVLLRQTRGPPESLHWVCQTVKMKNNIFLCNIYAAM